MSSHYQTTTLPERISIEQRDGATAVFYHRRISSPLGVALSVSAIVLYVLLLISLSTVLWAVPLWVRSLIALGATGIFYYAIEYLVSRAEFTVAQGILRVRYRPLPLRPSASVPVSHILRLAIEAQDNGSYDYTPTNLPTYRIFATLRNGARQVLLWDVKGRGLAVSLCQVLSAKLGVPGM